MTFYVKIQIQNNGGLSKGIHPIAQVCSGYCYSLKIYLYLITVPLITMFLKRQPIFLTIQYIIINPKTLKHINFYVQNIICDFINKKKTLSTHFDYTFFCFCCYFSFSIMLFFILFLTCFFFFFFLLSFCFGYLLYIFVFVY